MTLNEVTERVRQDSESQNDTVQHKILYVFSFPEVNEA